MNLTKLVISSVFTFVSIVSLSHGQNNFNKETDLFLAQFDGVPDTDDIHTQAAVGALLAHPDFQGVNYFCVAGAYGRQVLDDDRIYLENPRWPYNDSNALFELAFGEEVERNDSPEEVANARWVDAHGEILATRVPSQERLDNLDFAAETVKNKVKPILEAGGKVYVMEAGQSDVTFAWLQKLKADGVDATTIKNNVVVVQHSVYNQNNTTGHNTNNSLLDVVRAETTYIKTDDGNQPYNGAVDSSPSTPDYNEPDTHFITDAISANNPNAHARDLWRLVETITADAGYDQGVIPNGGVDFSDTVEAMWIFDLADASAGLTTVEDFFERFILNPTNTIEVRDEVNGGVIIEPENTISDLDEWEIDTEPLSNDFTGTSYLEFDPDGSSPNSVASGPPTSPLTYHFRINQSGLYTLELRCARETLILNGATRTDVANDCYVRVEGDYDEGPNAGDNNGDNALLELLQSDTKFFGGNDLSFVWAAGNRLDPGGEANKRRAVYDFKAGEIYTLVVSGRSEKFKLDRLVFRRSDVGNGTARNLNLTENLTIIDLSESQAEVEAQPVGNGMNYDISGTEASAFRSTSITKSYDVDGDNVYGTTGYFFYGNGTDDSSNTSGLPSWVSGSSTIDNVVVNDDYTDFDNPAEVISGTVSNWTSTGIATNRNDSPGQWAELFEFDIDEFAPRAFRLGILAGNEGNLDGRWDPSAMRILANGVAIAAVSDLGTDLGMVFFDLSLTDGEATISIEGETRNAGNTSRGPSIAGVVFDAIEPIVGVQTVGDGEGYDLVGTETLGFRSTNITKSFDLDNDNAYGTAGYFFFGNGSDDSSHSDNLPIWVSGTSSSNSIVVSNNYTDFDNPTEMISGTVSDWSSTGILTNRTDNPGEWAELFEFTIDTSAPNAFRLGLLAGNEMNVDGRWDASGFRILHNGEVVATVTELGSELGMVFFDISLQNTATETFTVEGETRSAGSNSRGPTLAGIVIDEASNLNYSAWLASFGVTDNGFDDEDGIPALIEYVLNGDPTASNPDIRPSLINNGNGLFFSFTRRSESTNDTIQELQYGYDLENWNEMYISTAEAIGVNISNITAKTEDVSINLDSIAQDERKVFVRLKVSQN